eukprot:CAMPEP_0183347524 /NCGR_PEP_ID=MMETSP0164_2-20130417/12332_1 /TAXON_ID=221442 /ORGANISM="Coccolithus pelagicus ssp braarudi, Strain PLY182g" /LENGTH=170 /DNA_ID=CAMNT_0025518969 /DNA_START=155 /DNA_END=664 /DNA_ORIENTATION=-
MCSSHSSAVDMLYPRARAGNRAYFGLQQHAVYEFDLSVAKALVQDLIIGPRSQRCGVCEHTAFDEFSVYSWRVDGNEPDDDVPHAAQHWCSGVEQLAAMGGEVSARAALQRLAPNSIAARAAPRSKIAGWRCGARRCLADGSWRMYGRARRAFARRAEGVEAQATALKVI